MHWRQGDLLIETIRTIPEGAVPLAGGVLAEGELTGHAHRIEDERTAQLFACNGQILLNIVAPQARIVHDEHGPIDLDRGAYRVWRQREYSPAIARGSLNVPRLAGGAAHVALPHLVPLLAQAGPATDPGGPRPADDGSPAHSAWRARKRSRRCRPTWRPIRSMWPIARASGSCRPDCAAANSTSAGPASTSCPTICKSTRP